MQCIETFERAVRAGDVPKVKELLAAGMVGVHEWIVYLNGETVPVLHYVMNGGPNSPEICRVFLEAGANPNVHDGTGEYPLHRAIRHGLLEHVAVLLQGGADVNAFNWNGKQVTCLTTACSMGDFAIAQQLLQHKADPNLRLRSEITPLWISVQEENWDLAHLLLDAGARVDEEPQNSKFLSRWICRQRCLRAGRLLFGILRFRVRICTGGHCYVLPRELCQQMARSVWATRKDAEPWEK